MSYNSAIKLMVQSPFQVSLPREFHAAVQALDVERAVNAAQQQQFSDATQFLNGRHRVRSQYENEVCERVLGNGSGSVVGTALQAKLASDRRGAHLIVKLLSEYALAHELKGGNEKLMTLDEVQFLQQQTQDLEDVKRELREQLVVHAGVVQTQLQLGDLVNEATWSHHNKLLQSLCAVDDKLEVNHSQLNRQRVLALSLMYFDDMALPEDQPQVQESDTDELLSYIASAAVQRNVTLPLPQSDGPKAKTQWSKSCIDALLDSNPDELVKDEVEETPTELSKMKTTLQDLQFAHQYLTKQYEEERNLNSGIMDSYKKKNMSLENKVSECTISLERATQKAILVEHEKNVLQKKLDELMAESHSMKREVAMLKLDQVGANEVSSTRHSGAALSTNTMSSPITGLSVSLGADEQPRTPQLQQQQQQHEQEQEQKRLSYISTHLPTPPSPTRFGGSISVLRGEFKKLVVELHADYDAELSRERAERRRLEHLLALYEQRMSLE